MKLLFENWRGYITEQVAGGPGKMIGTAEDVGKSLYRISRRDGIEQSRNKPSDRDFYYTNKYGDIEHRIFFFISKDEALGHFFSDVGELSAVVGDFEEDYDLSKLFITTFSADEISSDITFYRDPEFKNSSAIYGSREDGEPWEANPSFAEKAINLINDEEDEYYYETYN